MTPTDTACLLIDKLHGLDKKYLVKAIVSYLNQAQREEILDDLKREVF